MQSPKNAKKRLVGGRRPLGGILLGAILLLIALVWLYSRQDASYRLLSVDRTESVMAEKLAEGSRLIGEGRLPEAVDLFQELAQEQPDRPEAYNNLAAIFALQGKLEDSRQMLERALATHPSYATVYQNLGVVYAELARDSYGKALRLETSYAPATLQLLNGTPAAPGQAAPAPPASAQTASARTAPAPPAAAVPSDAASAPVAPPRGASDPPLPETATPTERPPASLPAPPMVAASPAAPPAPAAPAPSPEPAPPAPDPRQAEVRQALLQWAQAWSNQDVARYLASYSRSFRPEENLSRSAWEELRRRRLRSPRWIEVELSEFAFRSENSATVRVKAVQEYRASHYRGRTTKEFVLVREDGQWLIAAETSS